MSHAKLASLAGYIGAAVLALAIGPCAATSAFAADPDGPVSVKVSIADLNLSNEAGAREALIRIDRAARQVCGGGADEPSLTQWVDYRKCVAAAVERTVAGMKQPTLTAVSHSRHADTAIASAH
jgi:UrcA family protein